MTDDQLNFQSSKYFPPRCSHGNIILGCPDKECPEQNEYLRLVNAAIDHYNEQQQQEARRYVRRELGLDD